MLSWDIEYLWLGIYGDGLDPNIYGVGSDVDLCLSGDYQLVFSCVSVATSS